MGMLGSDMPPEISEYKERFFLGLTVRQMLCVLSGLGLAIPTAIWGSKVIPKDFVQWLVILETVPFALIGFYSYNGLPIEVVGKKIFSFYFCVQKRKSEYMPPVAELRETIRGLDFADGVTIRKKEKAEFKTYKKTQLYKTKRKAVKKRRKSKLKAVKKGNKLKGRENK